MHVKGLAPNYSSFSLPFPRQIKELVSHWHSQKDRSSSWELRGQGEGSRGKRPLLAQVLSWSL